MQQAAIILSVPAATENSAVDTRERVEFEAFARKGAVKVSVTV